MNFKLKTTTLAIAASALAFALPASAAIILANPSDFNGDNILFNSPSAITSGTSLLGFTNQTPGIGIRFEGTTTGAAVNGKYSLSATTGGGQATISATGNDELITSMWYYRDDGGVFNDTEFKLEGIAAGSTLRFYGYNQNGDEFDLGLATLGGDNRFGFTGTDGDVISKIKYVFEAGGAAGHKQTRLEDAAAAVPEPATWAMLIAGFGLVGAGMRRRSTVRVTYA